MIRNGKAGEKETHLPHHHFTTHHDHEGNAKPDCDQIVFAEESLFLARRRGEKELVSELLSCE